MSVGASNFAHLRSEWPEVYESAVKAETLAHPDPRSACFYARRALELAVHWLYKHDPDLKLPYQEHLNALLHEPTFRNTLGPAIFAKARVIQTLGNQAVHSHRPVRQFDAITVVKELFHFTFWLARTYARGPRPPDALAFNPGLLVPRAEPTPARTLDQLQALEAQVRDKDEKLSEVLEGRTALDAELERLRAEVAATRRANAA